MGSEPEPKPSGVARREIAARARRVTKTFGSAASSSRQAVALREVSVEIARGEVSALMGANGSGKTTLLRILSGMASPSSGEVEVLGVSSPWRASGRDARQMRARLSYLPQDLALDPEMTGLETLGLMAALYGLRAPQAEDRLSEVADLFGLGEHLGKRISGLSGGLRRRLHLACGLLHKAELVCLDEPEAGLDAESRTALWRALGARATGGAAVLVISHDPDAAVEHADRALLLRDGR
ncbi:MAG: ABC transporter ATP-binding protein, partial [Acidobacteriota bacterium]